MSLKGEMKALVIGGSLYFGKRLVRRLLEEGHEVTLLNRGSYSASEGVAHMKCDRSERASLQSAAAEGYWDVIFDQVCMTAPQARLAVEHLHPRCGRYVLTSSMSVYPAGANLSEASFAPEGHSFSADADPATDYAEAKRQVEAVFAKSGAPVTSVRLPIVLGPDDHTRRLAYHVERVRGGQGIYFPNLQAKISFISSADAAAALYKLGQLPAVGPVNVASEEWVCLQDLVREIQTSLGRTMKTSTDPEDHSPFGIPADWTLNVQKAQSSGVSCGPVWSWLRPLIWELSSSAT